jgi:poly-beta-1,6-N-acetyl-D-glucosamine synthase
MKQFFWLSLIFVCYTYAGYPLLLSLLAAFRKEKVHKGSVWPTVSVVVAAHNEENNIKARLENLLSQEYPKENFEVIVISDGSTDRTNEIAGTFRDRNVILQMFDTRQGKAVAVNKGVDRARGEIIVFTDVRQNFEPDVMSQLVANFNDPRVGCVSGELIFLEDRDSRIQAEMGAYWRYEKWIRKAESAIGSVVGATGAIYAIRRELYKPLVPGTILDDVLTPMNIVMQGYRTIFDMTAVAYDVVSKELAQEWKRKVRTLAGNWQMLSLSPSLLLPGRNLCWWRFLSHKIFRLIVPFALLTMLVSGALAEGSFYRFLTMLQLAFYIVAVTGLMKPTVRRIRIINLSCFFLLMNLAALAGFWRWVTGGCQTAWLPAYADQGSKP